MMVEIENLPRTFAFFQEYFSQSDITTAQPEITRRQLTEGHLPPGTIIVCLIMVFVCVTCSGLASGLTQGLLSLDMMEMKVKLASGTPKEMANARKVLPIISNHHFLLVTLLLWNAFAAEALPIFLDKLVPSVAAIIISVTLVLLFGEIIPASILTGPKQLEIAAFLTPLVYAVMFLFAPLAYPLSKVLDVVIGDENEITLYNRKELATIVRLQEEELANKATKQALEKSLKSVSAEENFIQKEEVQIIEGALKFRDIKAVDAMTSFSHVYMIPLSSVLTEQFIEEVHRTTFSRVPVFGEDRNDIRGIIHTKELIYCEDNETVEAFFGRYGHPIVVVWYDQNLSEVLATLKRENVQMAVVQDVFNDYDKDPTYRLCGVITLEDIMEEIVGAKITDLALTDHEVDLVYDSIVLNIPMLPLRHDRATLTDMILSSEICYRRRQTPDSQVFSSPSDMIVKRGKFMNYCIMILEGNLRLEYHTRSGGKSFFQYIASTLGDAAERNPLFALMDGQKVANHGDASPMGGEAYAPINVQDGDDDVEKNRGKGNPEIVLLGPYDVLCADALFSNPNSYAPNFNAYIESRNIRYVKLHFKKGKMKISKQHLNYRSRGVSTLSQKINRSRGSSALTQSSANLFDSEDDAPK